MQDAEPKSRQHKCKSQNAEALVALQVLRAVPKGARLLLECAGAVVAAAPSKFKACLHSYTGTELHM